MEVDCVYGAARDASESNGAYRTGLIIPSVVYFCRFCLCYFRGPRLCWQGTFLLGHYAAMEAAGSGTFQSASKTAEQKIAKRWRRRINTAACFEEDLPEEPSRGSRAPRGAWRNEMEDRL